jgi:hypothetical protein
MESLGKTNNVLLVMLCGCCENVGPPNYISTSKIIKIILGLYITPLLIFPQHGVFHYEAWILNDDGCLGDGSGSP